ncbi:MAG: hypothetical protein CSA50_07400 [Gammaproteobacteria bacterium]|nr:MAG: hypothetical protein CSA50_07400 [Gammaproteobacteria bacterium]
MTSSHELNSDLQKLTNQYHSGALNITDYRVKRREVLDQMIDANLPLKSTPVAPSKTAQKAKLIGILLIGISVLALALFGIKFSY